VRKLYPRNLITNLRIRRHDLLYLHLLRSLLLFHDLWVCLEMTLLLIWRCPISLGGEQEIFKIKKSFKVLAAPPAKITLSERQIVASRLSLFSLMCDDSSDLIFKSVKTRQTHHPKREHIFWQQKWTPQRKASSRSSMA